MINADGVWTFLSTNSTVSNGDVISIRMPSSIDAGTLTTATLTVGSSSSDYNITTVAPDTTPENFSFIDETDTITSTVYTSNTITVNGINTPTAISISWAWTYSINGWSFISTAGTISSMDTVSVRLTSPSSPSSTTSTTLTIWWITATYNISTPAPPPDPTPDAFTFIDLNDAWLATEYVSNTITISGINTSANISISNGEYEKNSSNSYTASPWTVSNGDTVSVRWVSSATPANNTDVILTIEWIQDTFTITTVDPDVTPESFTLSDISNAMVNTIYVSDTVVINDINTAVDIGVSLWEYSINWWSWEASAQSGVVNNGDEIRVRNTSNANWGTSRSMTLTVW